MSIPRRQAVTLAALNDILTREIQKIEDLEDATLKCQHILAEPDDKGCNWSGPLLNPGSKGSFEYADPHVRRIIVSARARYNVKVDGTKLPPGSSCTDHGGGLPARRQS